MMDSIYENLTHVLCVLLLIARLGDVGTTYLMSPRLVLEANPLVRRFGWPYAVGTLVVCITPYFSLQVAVAFLMASLLVSAGNAARVWAARVMGEQAQMEWMLSLARRGRVSHAIAGVWASSLFLAAAGGVIMLFYPTTEDWGFWLAIGIVGYGVAIGVHGTFFFVRLFKRAAQSP